MLQFNIKGYEEFKEVFGTKNSDRGTIQNKVLLSFWKYRYKIDGDGRASAIKTLPELYQFIMSQLNGHIINERYWADTVERETYPEGQWRKTISHVLTEPAITCALNFTNKNVCYNFFSKKYSTAISGGSISFAKPGYLRLKNVFSGNIEFIKGGKFLYSVMEDNAVKLDEPTKLYVCEEFQRMIDAETSIDENRYELHVDKKFDLIYSSAKMPGNFHSCMTDKGFHNFYKNCVNASSAYVIDKTTGNMIARCIIYHDVVTRDGKVHNYAERTYSADESAKHILIALLIKNKHIDIYKTIGAGCGDITSILDVSGNPYPEPYVRINMHIKTKDKISYMDTFRYYHKTKHFATNYIGNDDMSNYYTLAITSGSCDINDNSSRNETFNRPLQNLFSL